MTNNDNKIAIIGWAGRFPGAANIKEFIKNTLHGDVQICHFDTETLRERGIELDAKQSESLVTSFGYLDDIYKFDADFFAMSPAEAGIMDPQQRMLLELSYQGLCDAGYPIQSDLGNCGIYVGTGVSHHWLSSIYQAGSQGTAPDTLRMLLGNGQDFVATNIAYRLNLGGPSVNINTACSTSLVAIHQACGALLNYECDMALSGGSNVNLQQERGYFTVEGGIESPDGTCRPFDAKANGTVPGNGGAVVVLKRLADAIDDGDLVHAVIAGSAINNDGSDKIGFTAPSVTGQRNVIESAMAVAEVNPEDIGYIEAHGTGTHLGDPVEIQGLTEAFGSEGNGHMCAISSVKANVGHLNAAAGIAGLIRASACVSAGVLPKTANYQSLNLAINLANTPFYISDKYAPWPKEPANRLAGISSFGIGGSNAHIIVEQPQPASKSNEFNAPKHPNVCVLSAHSTAALEKMRNELVEFIVADATLNLHDLSYTLRTRRDTHKYRLACGFTDRQSLLSNLSAQPISVSITEPSSRIAFVFSGQGSQQVNMYQSLYRDNALFKEQVDECAEFIHPLLGLDIRTLIYPEQGGENDSVGEALLKETRFAQPALFIVQYALANVLISSGVNPNVMLGHSLGEYICACISGVMSKETALTLICARAAAMQEQPAGAMIAVSANLDECRKLLNSGISIAAVNGHQHFTLSGPNELIAYQVQRLDEANIRWKKLETSHAYHSDMMESAVDVLTELFNKTVFFSPNIPYASNISGELITTEQVQTAQYWLAHILKPVQFAKGLQSITEHCDIMLDLGPGSVLTSLLKLEQHQCVSLSGKDEACCLIGLEDMLAKLWQAGVPVDWQKSEVGEGHPIRLPDYPFTGKDYYLPATPVNKNISLQPAEQAIGCYRKVFHPSYLPNGDLAKNSLLIFCERNTPFITELVLQHGARVVSPNVLAGIATDSQLTMNWLHEGWHTSHDFASFAHGRATFIIIQPCELQPSDYVPLQLSLLRNLQASQQRSINNLKTLMVSHQAMALGLENNISVSAAMNIGFWRCVKQEYSSLDIQLVDMAIDEAIPTTKLIDLLASELMHGEPELAVMWRAGMRWLQQVEAMKQHNMPSAIKHGGVYIITGAMGKVGRLLGRYLSDTYQAKLVLISRVGSANSHITGFENTEQFMLESMNLDDLHTWQALLSRVSAKWGQINGLFHCATTGVKSFGLLSEITTEQWVNEFAAKVDCLEVIQAATRPFELDFVLVMSSVSALLGGLGHSAYSAANCYQDAFVQRHNQLASFTTRWLSINWDGWQTGLELNDADKAHALSDEDGLLLLEQALGDPSSPAQVVATCSPLQQRIEKWVKLNSLRTLNGGDSQGDVTERMRGIWSQLFGVVPDSDHTGFFTSGGDSMYAMLLVKSLQTEFNFSLPMQDLIVNDFSIVQLVELVKKASHEESAEVLWQPVFRMNSQSHQQKMIFIHSGGGSVLCYKDLATALEGHYECYGYRSGLEADTQQPVFETMQELAASYVDNLLLAVPEGPYNLAGYSLGGIIAFEIALQLQQRAVQVEKLVLFDPFPPFRDEHDQSCMQMSEDELFETLYLALCEQFGLEPIKLELPSGSTIEQKVSACIEQQGEANSSWKFWAQEYFRHNISQMYARNDYRPNEKYNGNTILIRIDDENYHNDRNDIIDLGWCEYTYSKVEVFFTEGPHRSLFNPSHINVTKKVFLSSLKL
ncbi:hypothetical protein PSECIP111854_00959 [Pseudoalteromonas sp. CIP111854]|uniref:Polyketide synthase n=1 Tax=Pseudoalteromonas holothuriae TaxID=2963714 RepID=A0A9W4VMW0_9GAMM|nr:type I polyketide synthase [Pseudoalteromonas sp. CIP111854]CAH9052385.1 hypothetical protein PSECIP111854_00959 [Pseudoalteromonas sp. CIP111854]